MKYSFTPEEEKNISDVEYRCTVTKVFGLAKDAEERHSVAMRYYEDCHKCPRYEYCFVGTLIDAAHTS